MGYAAPLGNLGFEYQIYLLSSCATKAKCLLVTVKYLGKQAEHHLTNQDYVFYFTLSDLFFELIEKQDLMRISAIITNYNYGRYLARGVRSLLDQSIDKSEYEIIVVDDNSSDHSLEILQSFNELIRVIKLEENVGLAEARNIGIKSARGQYVVFIDADDYVQSDLLYIQQQFLNHNHQFGAVSVDYVLVDEFENHVSRVNAEECPIACGIMFRLDSLIDIGLYDKNFRAHEEKDLRIRFQEKFEIYNIILPLYRYRRHDNNLTNNEQKMSKYSQLLSDKHELKGD